MTTIKSPHPTIAGSKIAGGGETYPTTTTSSAPHVTFNGRYPTSQPPRLQRGGVSPYPNQTPQEKQYIFVGGGNRRIGANSGHCGGNSGGNTYINNYNYVTGYSVFQVYGQYRPCGPFAPIDPYYGFDRPRYSTLQKAADITGFIASTAGAVATIVDAVKGNRETSTETTTPSYRYNMYNSYNGYGSVYSPHFAANPYRFGGYGYNYGNYFKPTFQRGTFTNQIQELIRENRELSTKVKDLEKTQKNSDLKFSLSDIEKAKEEAISGKTTEQKKLDAEYTKLLNKAINTMNTERPSELGLKPAAHNNEVNDFYTLRKWQVDNNYPSREAAVADWNAFIEQNPNYSKINELKKL